MMEFLGIGFTGLLHKQIDSLNNAYAVLKKENESLKSAIISNNTRFENALRNKDAEVENKKKLFDRSIVVKCPWCDFAVTLPLNSIPDTVNVSEVLSGHICSDHWVIQPTLNESSMRRIEYQTNNNPKKSISICWMEACKNCNFNYKKLMKKEASLNSLKEDYDAMSLELSWVYVAENEDTVAYTGYNSDSSLFDIFHVKKLNIYEIPVKIDVGKYVYSDGSVYPVSLIDFIHLHSKKGRPVGVPASADTPFTTLSENEDKILEFIRSNPNCFHGVICKGLNLPKSSVSVILKKLEETKLILKNLEGGFSVIQPE